MTKKIYFLHPFLFSISSAVFLWGQNFGEVPLREVWTTLLVLSVFGGMIFGFFGITFRNIGKSALASSFLLVVILFFDYIYNIFFYNPFIQIRWRWVFFILAFIVVVVLFFIKNTKKDLFNINKIITIIIGIFILSSFLQVIFGYFAAYTGTKNSNIEIIASNTDKELRDIYYIILDGYSSPEVIKNVFGFDGMDTTVDFLRERGFFVASSSTSNYGKTLYSLPSSLNMTYIQNPKDHKNLFMMAENHKVKDFLKQYGYKYIHFGSNAFTYFNRYADENVNIGLFTPYQAVVWHTTLLRPIQDLFNARFDFVADKFGFLDMYLTQFKREKLKLQKLAEISGREEDYPVFAFAHFLIPKGFEVFDENGDFLTKEESNKRGTIKNYIGHVAYINKEIEKLVDVILENSDIEPIIIIQGDHGFPFWGSREVIEDLAQPDRAKELVVKGQYSFPIFNVYYFPDGGDALLYNSITPINTFRLLFNYYFNQNLELLGDINYIPDTDGSDRFIPYVK